MLGQNPPIICLQQIAALGDQLNMTSVLKVILITIIILCTLVTCSSTGTSPLTESNFSISSILGESRKSVSTKLGIVLEDEFGYLFENKKYFVSSHGSYAFIFDDNSLINIADSQGASGIWNRFPMHGKYLPYYNELHEIHNRLVNLPLYISPPLSSPQQENTEYQNTSGQVAAVTMMVLALPLMPFILADKYKGDRARGLDWIYYSLDSDLSKVSKLLGKSYKSKSFDGNTVVVGYSNPRSEYRSVRYYVGVKDGKVVWALNANSYILD